MPLLFVLKITLSEDEYKQIKSSLVKVGFYTHENEDRTSLEITYEYILVYPDKIQNPQYSIEESYAVRQAIEIDGKIFARASGEFVNRDFRKIGDPVA